MIHSMKYDSPIGSLLLAELDGGLIGLWLKEDKTVLSQSNCSPSGEKTPILLQTTEWLDRYFSGEKPEISELKLSPSGGIFRQTVWSVLCEIPYGKTVSYGEVAKETAARLGKERMSAQAAGGAIGKNPISIIIPCHRVIGANGSLTGYGGGIEKKIKLLRHEGVDMTGLYIPKTGTEL